MANDTAIGKIGDLLADKAFREAFKKNSSKALRDQGLDPTTIDAPVLTALKNLSADQLAAMSSVGKALRDVKASGDAGIRIV